MIHPTHSKKDLLTLCEVFNIEIEDMYDLRKNKLVIELEKYLDMVDYIEPEEDYYFVDDIEALITYLEKPNPSKSLTITQRQSVIDISRDIISYCRRGYDLEISVFDDIDELLRCAKKIAPYGDISTCRRALYLLRRDSKIRPSIEPEFSNKMKKKLEAKEEARKASLGVMRVTRGKFAVEFA